MDEQQNLEKEGQQAAQQVMPPQKKPGRMALQIFAIVVLLGLVGYGVYAWQNNRVAQLERQVTELKKTDTTSTGTSTTTSDPYKGWNSFTSDYQQTSFKYPSNWKLTKAALDVSMWPGAVGVELQGPNGLKVYYTDVVDGIGGGCEDTAPKVEVADVESVNGAIGKSGIWLVTDKYGLFGLVDYDTAGGVPKVGKTESCLYYTLMKSKAHDNQSMSFTAGSRFMIGQSQSALTVAQKKDLAEAKLILQSFKFNN